MMRVPIMVRPSAIHGHGLYATRDIAAGETVWEFGAGDSRLPWAESSAEQRHFGYVNPAAPAWLVVCGDAARWWNFALGANCEESAPPSATHEAPIRAARAIAAGEELTITFTSDADAARKLGALTLTAPNATPSPLSRSPSPPLPLSPSLRLSLSL
jgi:SET domain-containing protein